MIRPSGPGAPPSNTRMGQVTLDFGAGNPELDTAVVTVPATWIRSTSIVIPAIAAIGTSNHDPEDAVIEELQVKVINIVPNVSFDLYAFAPSGSSGQYVAVYQGLISRNPP